MTKVKVKEEKSHLMKIVMKFIFFNHGINPLILLNKIISLKNRTNKKNIKKIHLMIMILRNKKIKKNDS